MQATLGAYRARIQSGEVNPLVHWDGRSSRTLLDPADDATPLVMLACGACRLDDGPHTLDTKDREYVFVPIDGTFEVAVGGETFGDGQADGNAEIVQGMPGKTILNINAYKKGSFVWKESFFPGWNLYLDESRGIIRPWKELFRQWEIPKGKTRAVQVYQPLSFRLGLALSIFSILFLIFACIIKLKNGNII